MVPVFLGRLARRCSASPTFVMGRVPGAPFPQAPYGIRMETCDYSRAGSVQRGKVGMMEKGASLDEMIAEAPRFFATGRRLAAQVPLSRICHSAQPNGVANAAQICLLSTNRIGTWVPSRIMDMEADALPDKVTSTRTATKVSDTPETALWDTFERVLFGVSLTSQYGVLASVLC